MVSRVDKSWESYKSQNYMNNAAQYAKWDDIRCIVDLQIGCIVDLQIRNYWKGKGVSFSTLLED